MSLYIEGLVTDDHVDLDGQIVDHEFAARALNRWFDLGGWVLNMHDGDNFVTAGEAVDMQVRPRSVWIRARIDDPEAIADIESGFYRGFSVCIVSPTIVPAFEGIFASANQFVPGGRVIDGAISEVSLVPVPASLRAKFTVVDSPEMAAAAALIPNGGH